MDVSEIRNLDLVGVCGCLGLMPDPNDPKQFKTDGLRISVDGFKWFDHVTGKGGGGAIDLTMHVLHLPFRGAVDYLGGMGSALPTVKPETVTKPKQSATNPPAPHKNNLPAVLAYLTDKRGLNADLVKWCIEKGFIFADFKDNCVFRYGTTGAELRGTGAKQWRGVLGVIETGFILPAPQAQGIALLESAIDALSYRQIRRDKIAVSIAGNTNHAVIEQAVLLAKFKGVPVYSAFDNDKGGNVALAILKDYANKHQVNHFEDRPKAKDWNEQLLQGGY